MIFSQTECKPQKARKYGDRGKNLIYSNLHTNKYLICNDPCFIARLKSL